MLLRLLFPPTCLGCGLLLRTEAPATLPLCRCCGLEHVPLHPRDQVHGGVAALHGYGGPLRSALARLKFHGQTASAGPLGAVLAASPLWRARWDAVIPVPLHPRRVRQRGFNQSALLARHALRQLPLRAPPLRTRWLKRIRDTKPQHQLPAGQRETNVRDAFAAARPRAVAGLAILLVDDVTTTGATLSAAAKALTEAGATTVGALALLRAVA